MSNSTEVALLFLYNITTGGGDGGPVTINGSSGGAGRGRNLVLESANNAPCGVFFFVVYGPLFGTVCLLGLVGNSLSFAVLHKYSRSNVSTYLLKALAVSDNLFLATASFVQIYPAMCMYFGMHEHLSPIYPYIQTYGWPWTHCVQMGTVYMMVLVAANRYIAVCKPLQATRLCSKTHVQFQILLMTVLIVLYNVPRFFEYRHVLHNVTLADNTTVEMDKNVGFASIHLYNILYENVAYCIFVFLLPLAILIFFNVHLVRELKKAQRNRKVMTSRSSQEENNITLVMIVIIIVFIVCQTPASVNQILYYVIGKTPDNLCTNYQRYSDISNLLITMNSALNFVIYCLFRRQFQQELYALMCRRRSDNCRALRRTIVLRAMHNDDNSTTNSRGNSHYGNSRSSRNSHSTLRSKLSSTASSIPGTPPAHKPPQAALIGGTEDDDEDEEVGEEGDQAGSPDTMTSHLTHYSNGKHVHYQQADT